MKGCELAYVRLDGSDYDEVFDFVAHRSDLNVVLLNDMMRFGMDPGDSPFSADYFGRQGLSGLEAVGALYNLGALFFRARSDEAVSGMADYLAELGRFPAYTAGTRSHVEVLLEEIGERGPRDRRAILSEYMVLTGAIKSTGPSGAARAATIDDLETLVSMQVEFERESFGRNLMERDTLRRLLAYQISEGAAAVVESGGRIVSKAESTVARPYSALVGGVYTLPEMRGRGFSTSCLSALCGELLGRVGSVGLNVFRDNHPARAVYRKVGFQDAEAWLTVEMG
jgi:hypothetical protein